MAYLQWNITGNTTARDLLEGSAAVPAAGTAATATPADASTASSTNRVEVTKTNGRIESILIANNYTAASTVDLYTERWDGDGAGGTKMYILNSVVMPAGTSLVIDTPIRFNRSTDGIFASVANSSESITIYMNYHLTKSI